MLKVLETEQLTVAQTWAASIRAAYARTVESVIAVGRELLAAKAALPHGEFERMVRRELPFNERTAQAYMAIANCPRLCDPEVRPMLPNALSSLQTLARLDDEVWSLMMNDKVITADKTNNELVGLSDLYTSKARMARTPPRPVPKARPFLKLAPPSTPMKADPPAAGNWPSKESPKPEFAPEAVVTVCQPSSTLEPQPIVQAKTEPEPLEGEYLAKEPAKPEPPPTPRQGVTIDNKFSYQTHEQLLRGAYKLFDKVVHRDEPVDKVQALQWITGYLEIVKYKL